MPGLTDRDRWLLAAPGRELKVGSHHGIVSPKDLYVDVWLLEHGTVVVHTTSRYSSTEAENEALELVRHLERGEVA